MAVRPDSLVAMRPGSLSLNRLERSGKLAFAAVVALVVSLSVFIGDGSQLAYLMALAFAATTAASLGWSRSWLAALLIVALATLVGTEMRGELGRGTAPLGSLRLLDVALLAAVAGLFARDAVDGGLREAGHTMLLRRGPLSIETRILAAATGWAGALWIANGAEWNAFMRADVRLILLVYGTYVLAKAVLPGQWPRFTLGLLALAPMLALKAGIIYVTDFFTVGTFDRLQTAFVQVPSKRVILVGGDTLLVLTPALATAMALRAESRAVRWLCTLAAAFAMGGVLLSGSRTGLLIAAAMVLVTLCLPMGQRRLRMTRLSALAAVLIVAATVTGAYVTGVGERLVTRDLPHVGLNFRGDEIQTASSLPQRDLLLGQGLGGSFLSKDARGAAVETGWSHVLPVWLVLKVGLLGLLALLVALGLFVRRAARAIRRQRRGPAMIGAQLVGGLILMSLTVGRLAQPEGAMLVAIGVVLVGPHMRREVSCG